MKTFNIDDIRSWGPCYDPARYLSEDWCGTALDVLYHDKIPAKDKLWVVLRGEALDKKTLRLFAVWCARQVQHLMTDKRSIAAIDVAERYAHSEATEAELKTACADADAAVFAAAADAAAARAARAAADAARAVLYDKAYAAEPEKQVAKLIKMLEGT